jgi:hypothetical protein
MTRYNGRIASAPQKKKYSKGEKGPKHRHRNREKEKRK